LNGTRKTKQKESSEFCLGIWLHRVWVRRRNQTATTVIVPWSSVPISAILRWQNRPNCHKKWDKLAVSFKNWPQSAVLEYLHAMPFLEERKLNSRGSKPILFFRPVGQVKFEFRVSFQDTAIVRRDFPR
jgi:hypothetical protein